MSPVVLVISGLLLCAALSALSLFWWMDRHELRSGFFALIVLLWGALSLPIASWSYRNTSQLFSAEGVLYRSLLEILLLLPGLLLVFGAKRFFEGPVDGWLLGSLAGFGAVSTAFLAPSSITKTVLLQAHSPFFPALLLGIFLEILVPACIGSSLGYSRVSGGRKMAILYFPLGLLVGFGIKAGSLLLVLHFGKTALAVLPVLAPVAWLGLLFFCLSFEAQVLGDELREEVEFKVLPEWILEVFPFRRRRIRGDWGARLAERRVLNEMAAHLAFRKRALRRISEEHALDGLEIVRLREGLKTRLEAVEYPGGN